MKPPSDKLVWAAFVGLSRKLVRLNVRFYAIFDVRKLFIFMEGVGRKSQGRLRRKTQGLRSTLFSPLLGN